jgi:hypothetical protein
MNIKKTLSILILVAFLVSTIAAIPIQPANAVATQKTYPIADAIPNPVGVGQQTLLKCGISEAAPSASYGWTGITITVTKPDGTTETLGPFTTDSTGSTYTLYTPNQVGNYTITTNFPNNTFPITATVSGRTQPTQAGTILLASTKSITLEVTSEAQAQPFYPGHALPSEYWSRPIDPQLREWYSISGNWVERPANSFVQYQDDAPNTPHILWNTPYEQGGISGGLYDGENNIVADMYGGDAYEGRFANSVVINGVLYYNTQGNGLYAQVSIPGIQAIDLHTGEKLWFLNNTFLSFGQTMFFPSYNVNGVWNYLWSVNGNNYTAYSTNDGSFQFMFYNVPSGTRIFGPNGEILIYQINYNAGWMALWNSTLAGQQNAVIGQPSYGSWSFGALGMDASGRGARDPGGPTNPTNAIGQQINSAFPVTRLLNGALDKCYTWNVTIPKGLTSNFLKAYQGDRIVGMAYNQTMVRVWALPLNGITTTRNATINTQTLTPIFDKTWAAPSEWLEGSNILYYTGASNYVTDPVYGNGVIAVFDKELTTHYGFSVVDGSYLWATESENYLDLYGSGAGEHTWYFAYGKLYSVGLAGIMYAYNLQTGHTDWTYTLKDPYTEPVTGENWWGWIDLIADGKIYIGTLEHSANSPMPRGGPYACVNATDGSEIFRVNGLMRETRWGGNPVMGDSIIAGFDTYDLQIYAMGKGPSKTTVSAPNLGAAPGQSVVIAGRVTDISPGTTDSRIALRFPNGVAAVSDESQSQYMLYVYKQFEMPTNTTGVPVTISVVDANGNFREIGTTTTDSSGSYSLSWIPDIPGKYTVIATFAGSNAYYGSSDQAAFVVDQTQATATPPTTQQTTSMADLYFLPMSIAIIVVIIVAAAVIVLSQRKRA